MKKVYIFSIFVIIAVFISWQPAFAQIASTWLEKGDLLEEKGLHSEAAKAYTNAVEHDSDSAEAYLKRGIAFFSDKKSNCTEALSDFTMAIKLAPDNAEAYYRRGVVNYYMINNEQGRADMETAASLGHEGAREWLGLNRETIVMVKETPPKVKPAVYFDHDKFDIKPLYYKLLEEVGTALAGGSSQVSIVLSGHADSTGTEQYNDALSLERANAVKKYLVKHFNITSGRIAVTGYGEGDPTAANDTPEGRALNRRVEISGLEITGD